MTDKKAEQEKDSVVKKLLSSNLTWSVVALIVLIIICTISDHQFLSLRLEQEHRRPIGPADHHVAGIGALSHDRNRHDAGDLHRRY